MATRSSSNKKVTKRNTNVPPPARNYSDNTQAVKRIPGVTYGEQDALVEQQKIAPLPKTGTPNVQATSRPMPNVDVFGETEFTSEPVTSGLPFGSGASPTGSVEDDPDMLLRAIYAVYPDPMLLKYLRGQGGV